MSVISRAFAVFMAIAMVSCIAAPVMAEGFIRPAPKPIGEHASDVDPYIPPSDSSGDSDQDDSTFTSPNLIAPKPLEFPTSLPEGYETDLPPHDQFDLQNIESEFQYARSVVPPWDPTNIRENPFEIEGDALRPYIVEKTRTQDAYLQQAKGILGDYSSDPGEFGTKGKSPDDLIKDRYGGLLNNPATSIPDSREIIVDNTKPGGVGGLSVGGYYSSPFSNHGSYTGMGGIDFLAGLPSCRENTGAGGAGNDDPSTPTQNNDVVKGVNYAGSTWSLVQAAAHLTPTNIASAVVGGIAVGAGTATTFGKVMTGASVILNFTDPIGAAIFIVGYSFEHGVVGQEGSPNNGAQGSGQGPPNPNPKQPSDDGSDPNSVGSKTSGLIPPVRPNVDIEAMADLTHHYHPGTWQDERGGDDMATEWIQAQVNKDIVRYIQGGKSGYEPGDPTGSLGDDTGNIGLPKGGTGGTDWHDNPIYVDAISHLTPPVYTA